MNTGKVLYRTASQLVGKNLLVPAKPMGRR